MWESKVEKAGCASPCTSQKRTASIGNNLNSKLDDQDTTITTLASSPARYSTLLAAIFEPILYPFAVLALRILIISDEKFTTL